MTTADAATPAKTMTTERVTLTAEVKAIAHAAGFDVVGIATAEPFERCRPLPAAAASPAVPSAACPGSTRSAPNVAEDPRNLLPEVRSIVSLGLSYRTTEPEDEPGSGPRGRIARYAWALDYHAVLKSRMAVVVAALQGRYGAGECRALVDTARIIDRAAAQRAGTGWYGKNTNIINPAYGSWMLLGEILTSLELVPDPPLRKHCGSCALCITACPTGAITAPYELDSNRCISYLTIEHRGPIPREIRPLIGDWIFGCDICQEVCPPAQKGRVADHPPFQAVGIESARPALIPLLSIDDAEFRTRFATSPVKRAKREGLQRNVAVALGNSGDRTAVPALIDALVTASPMVRGHAAWALGRLGGSAAHAALVDRRELEDDPWVQEEIALALASLQADAPPNG